MFNVLIVEDDADIRILLGEQLQDKGCHVWRSSNGASALRRVTEKLPDIIFVDIMMPVMDGIDLITELQESPERCLSTNFSTSARYYFRRPI